MGSPFNTESVPLRMRNGLDDRITLVNGRTFTIADRVGHLTRPTDGTIFEDLRMLSRFEIAVGVVPRERLATDTPTPFESVIVSRPVSTDTQGREVIVHRQWIGRGVRHDIEVHNTSAAELTEHVTVEFDTDFAHIFDVKNGTPVACSAQLVWVNGEPTGYLIDPDDDARKVDVVAVPAPDEVDHRAKRMTWLVRCPAHSIATCSVTFEPVWDHVPAGLAFPLGTAPTHALPALRLDAWRQTAPSVDSDDKRLSVAFDAALADLASLRIFDPSHPDRTVIAAGAPWFMTLFGRDSLLTSWMCLPFVPELALGVLEALAELQGSRIVPETEEAPGKIIHELRGRGGDDTFADRGRYYGTVDATPLFVMVAAEAHRWGHLDGANLERLWPNVRAAVQWVERSITRDPAGWLQYERSTGTGLINQGWKDSWDGVTDLAGRIPRGSVALSEVQGYAYAALRDGAMLARLVDEPGVDADALEDMAAQLRERFETHFWMEDAGSYALGIGHDGSLIDSITTNPGHAVWAGITDADRAGRYLDRIMDDLFTGWGLRTLSPTAAAYNPLSYHNGSVWPHDTALVAAGAARIGRFDAASMIVDAALDTAARFDGRPPELFAGVDRAVIDVPVSYPDSCSPQAWASASTLLNVRTVLGLDPPSGDASQPNLDARAHGAVQSRIRAVRGIRVGDRRLDIDLSRSDAEAD